MNTSNNWRFSDNGTANPDILLTCGNNTVDESVQILIQQLSSGVFGDVYIKDIILQGDIITELVLGTTESNIDAVTERKVALLNNYPDLAISSEDKQEDFNGAIVELVRTVAFSAGAGLYTKKLTPTSEVPLDIPNQVFLVIEPGTYINFGNVILPVNHFGFIFKAGDQFSIQTIQIPVYDDAWIKADFKKINTVELPKKVDKVEGKGLSENDFTTAYKNEVDKVQNKIDKVEGKGLSTHDYDLAATKEVAKVKDKVDKIEGKGLSSFDYDLAATKEVSKVKDKVDKVEGKGLSSNDFTNGHKNKVDKVNITGEGKNVLTDNGEYVALNSIGGGFYNVSKKFPIKGFYDLASAIVVVGNDTDLDAYTIKGMIITFESEANVWSDFRFLGTALIELKDIEKWTTQSVRNVIKSIDLYKGVEKSTLTPDENGNVVIEIDDIKVDETLEENSTNAAQSGAVWAAFNSLEAIYGASIRLNKISEGNYSLSLLDAKDEEISTTETFSGGGGGGGTVVNVKAVLEKRTENLTLKSGDKAELTFFYDQQDEKQASTGIGATATITVARGATNHTYTMDLSADSTTTIDVTQYIAVGTSNVRVRVVTNDEYRQVATIAWTVSVVQLKLESSFNIATQTIKGSNITIPYALTGSGTKTLELYLNGVLVDDKTITSSSSTGSFSIATTNMTHSVQAVQMRSKLELNNGQIIYSNTIYFGIVVIDPARTTTLVATRFDYPDGRIIATNTPPTLVVSQYSKYSIIFAAYTPDKVFTDVVVNVDNVAISKTSVRFARTEIQARAYASGNFNANIVAGTYTSAFTVEVIKLGVDLVEPTNGLLLKLNSDGRSNSDVNREEWKYQNIDTKFENFTWVGDGWLNGALRLLGSAKATINFTPLAQGIINENAFTFSTRLKVSASSDSTTEIMKCIDADGVGFVITSQEARMVTKGNSVVSTKFAEGKEYNIGFVSFPVASADATDYEKTNSSMLYLYVDGVISGGILRGPVDQVYQSKPAKIVLAPIGKCTIDLFSVRSYNRALTDAEMLNTYLIDLIDPEILIEKFLENNILNESGNISVDNLPKYLPYMIITGKAENNRAMVLEAAAINNKDSKYDVDEILFVNPLDPSMNFKNAGGSIRLQGTSSLAYPVKNYRIYFKNANKVNGVLSQGVDKTGAGGSVVETNKYSFRKATSTQKAAIPVDCFCLKADYAESSSSHNTGTARIVHEVNNTTGDITPAQKLVSADYQYDVRTTIDGFPMLLFYRENISDTPKFLSKFNFNNDKSTEDVFGFLNIPGYHDQSWVTTKFGGKNPTECWEFLNNDYLMGVFKDDDFITKGPDGLPNWMKVFEPRFLGDSSKEALYASGAEQPYYLQRLVKWLKSTDTTVVGLSELEKTQRATKFKNELPNYFDVAHIANYYQFTDILGAVDQRVKNMMLGFWYSPTADKVLAYMIFYDNDTILGVRNDGTLKYNWDIDHNTLDPELSTQSRQVYAYAGRQSVLWENLRNVFSDELQKAYTRIRSKLTNDYIFRIYNTEQSKKYVERIYNLDAINKYVIPSTKGVEITPGDASSIQVYAFLGLMQGSRASHREWWLSNRLNLLDAKFNTGLYKVTDLTFKGNSATGATIKAVASRDYYFAFTRESAVLVHQKVTAGQEFTFTYNNEANIGTIFHFYGGDWVKKIDLSNWGGFTSINIPRLKVLEELILGKDGATYVLPTFSVGGSLPLLRKFDIRNYTEIPTLDLSQCSLLEDVNATGCLNLSSIKFYSGAPLSKLRLPSNYKNLTLLGLPLITNAGITFDDINALETIYIDQCELLNAKLILDQVLSTATPTSTKKYLRVNIGNFSDDATYIRRLNTLNLGGLTTAGEVLDNQVSITGIYQLTKSVPEAELAALKVKFPELNILRPEYTVIEYDLLTADPANVSNLDNSTGYKFGNEYKPSGVIEQILLDREKVQVKRFGNDGLMYYPLEKSFDNRTTLLNSSIKVSAAESYGGCFIIEPQVYVKGINDVLNNKNYVLWAKDKPKDLIFTRVLFSALDSVETGKALDIREDSLANMTINNASYSICTTTVAKKTFVRFPSITSTDNSLGWVFLDVNGTVLKKNKTNYSAGSMQDGMYVIEAVPINAVKLKFTILTAQTYDPVRLTTDSSIYALEEWVERPKSGMSAGFFASYQQTNYYLIHNTTTSVNHGRELVVSWLARTPSHVYYQDIKGQNKHFNYPSTFDYNVLRHFFFSVFGTRNIYDKVGTPKFAVTNTYWEAAIPDAWYPASYSTVKNPATSFCAHKTQDELGNPIYSAQVNMPIALGYVNFGSSTGEAIRLTNEQIRIPFKVNTYTDVYTTTQTIHGKYLDIYPIRNNKVGTTSTYFVANGLIPTTNGFPIIGRVWGNDSLIPNMNTTVITTGSDGATKLVTVFNKFTKATSAEAFVGLTEIF